MHTAKEMGGYSLREDCLESPEAAGTECSSPCCSMARARRSLSVSEAHEDILNMSPRLSLQIPSIRLQRRLHYQNSLRNSDMSLQRSSSSSMASTETTLQKPAAELIKEIATLELEVVHMERYLLSLYRTAFAQYITSSPTSSTANISMSPQECLLRSLVPDPIVRMEHQSDHADKSNHINERMNLFQDVEENEIRRTNNFRHIDDSPKRHLTVCSDIKGGPSPIEEDPKICGPPPREEDPKIVEPTCVASHRSLADHLGASLADHVPDSPCKLSEDIIRCISAIYCKLSNPSMQQIDIIDSPTPSVSSSSMFSPKDPRDSWSPRCHYKANNASPCQYDTEKEKFNPYSSMVEVPRISIDGDRFRYASKMLNIFRSLIRRLETIDPRNMGYEEKLAFWINIHNSLVMHAFLAYGLHQNQMKSTCSILKAAYNVGGHSVNAHVIQSSILRCQLHRPAEGLRSLFSPKKLMKGDNKHQYALSPPPEPLVHFALCLGAYSDPAIKESIRGEQPCTVCILSYRKDGRSFWNRLHISPVRNATGKAMIFGGTNNTTLYMAMTLATLLSNPDVLKKVQDELEIRVGKNRVVEYSDIEILTYLQAVIKEVFRLYPSAQLNVPHEATEECQIQGFNVQTQGFTREYDEHRSRSRRIQCTRYKYSIME